MNKDYKNKSHVNIDQLGNMFADPKSTYGIKQYGITMKIEKLSYDEYRRLASLSNPTGKESKKTEVFKKNLPKWLIILACALGVYSVSIMVVSFMFLQPVTAFILTTMSILGILVISLLTLATRANIE